MAARPMGFLEKIASMSGALYRHQAAQWPRRSALLREVYKRELAPPKSTEWPAIKADFSKVVKSVESGAYKSLSVREALVYAGVALEVTFWFFAGEMIGRRHVFGYLVPADYVSADTKAKVKEAAEKEARGY